MTKRCPLSLRCCLFLIALLPLGYGAWNALNLSIMIWLMIRSRRGPAFAPA